MENETFTVFLPTEWYDHLTKDAEVEGVSKEDIIVAALKLYYS